MSFNWNDLLVLAVKLASPEDACVCKEACHRSSISRAYYSVFVQVRAKMRLVKGKNYDGSGCHGELLEDLKTMGTINSANLHAIMKTLKDYRVYADYKAKLPDPDSKSLADTQVAAANKALIYLKDLNT